MTEKRKDKAFQPKIVSANDLFEGDVVYLDGTGSWTRDISEAAVAGDAMAADELLARAEQPGKVVGPYLFDVTREAGAPEPVHFRERFRKTGPSVDAGFVRAATSTITAQQDAAQAGEL